MKAKALISRAVTSQLICALVFAYAKSRFSHDVAQIRYELYIIKPCIIQSCTCFCIYMYLNNPKVLDGSVLAISADPIHLKVTILLLLGHCIAIWYAMAKLTELETSWGHGDTVTY